MTVPLITLITAGVLGLFFVVLSIRVVRQRLSTGVSLGQSTTSIVVGNTPEDALLVATRTHANFAEYVPLSLLLLFLLEQISTPRWMVIVLAVTLVGARVAHAVGMSLPAPNPWRVTGTSLQWTVLAIASGYCVYGAIAASI